MIAKIRAALAPFLLHPAATAFAAFTGLVSGFEVLGTQLQQLGWQLGPIAYYLPHSTKAVVGLTIASSACTLFASMGRSIISWVDKAHKSQPPGGAS